jgi:hypothetical protein
MGRRQTAGVAGGSGVGGVNFENTTITAADNLDITIDPSGTGIFKIAGDAQLQAQGNLRFADADSSNYVAFQGANSIAANVTWTLPSADGSNGQFLSTNSSGTLSWISSSIPLTDNTVDATSHYPLLTTSTSGSASALRVSSTRFSFQPSTGNFSTGGRITAGGATVLSGFTTAYSTTGLTLDANGFLSAYIANNKTISSITYATKAGSGAAFGGSYRVPVSWTETDNNTTIAKSVAVTYATDGTVSAIVVT